MSTANHAKAAKRCRTHKKKAQSSNVVIENLGGTLVKAECARSVYETFSADIKLQEGLSIIRDLDGGMYEIINLKRVTTSQFGSQEVGRSIRSIPKRLAVLVIDEAEWANAKLKCGQGVMSARR